MLTVLADSGPFRGLLLIVLGAVGVDGLTYLPSLPLLSLLDGLKPY